MQIGVDVGGTNTDAVLMDGERVVATIKTPTAADVGSGIIGAVSAMLDRTDAGKRVIDSVMIGTTQFTNAFVERDRLIKVGVIRLGLPASSSLLPFVDWPEDLVQLINSEAMLAHGGYQFDGQPIAAFDEEEIRNIARGFRAKGVKSIALSCVFAPVCDEMEKRAAAIVGAEIPGAKISKSSEIGRVGLVERENATIINASLAELADFIIEAFYGAFEELHIDAPLFISQNDGTVMSPEHARKYPVLTFASGPTNSMRGAAFLSGLKEAIVVDIGGTTTDVGVIAGGFPRESSISVDIGGVRTNFRMPDILAIGLGGGSLVEFKADGARVGPQSVGYELMRKAYVFGGDTLTATDIVVAAGVASIGDPKGVADLNEVHVVAAMDVIHASVEEALDKVKTAAGDADVVLVGGGSILINRPLRGASRVHIPEHADVANAIGASLAQVSGEVDRVFSYERDGREQALDVAKHEAIDLAVRAGSRKETVEIIDVEELPLAYLPGGSVRLRVKAVGDLDHRAEASQA